MLPPDSLLLKRGHRVQVDVRHHWPAARIQLGAGTDIRSFVGIGTPPPAGSENLTTASESRTAQYKEPSITARCCGH